MTNTIRLNTRKGQVAFESAFATDGDALRRLVELVREEHPAVARSDFARDLVAQARRHAHDGGRALSRKQLDWVHKLATDALAPKPEAPAGIDADLSGIVELMDLAADAQKRAPRIVLRDEAGNRVVLKRAGDRSAQPGTINVTDGGPFGDNVWFGRVLRDGKVAAGRSMTDGVRRLLAALAADPAKVAGQHGIATGECCFCASPLSTAESRSVGYGPICAGKYGLPWGDTTVADAADAAAKAAGERIGAGDVPTADDDGWEPEDEEAALSRREHEERAS